MGGDLSEFCDARSLKMSKRLGINYEGVKDKFMAGVVIPDKFEMPEIIPLGGGWFKAGLQDGRGLKTEFYFKDGKLATQPDYYTSDWEVIETRFFKVFCGEAGLTNIYALESLDKFVEETCLKLEMPEEKIKLLESEKIYYYLCGDKNEVKKLTGFNARGMYHIGFDYIVSAFTCHYHEIVHLLVNFRLGDVPRFTHPFMQEGIAVALGGRGGRSLEVLLQTAVFLEQSGFINSADFLSMKYFRGMDATISYPVSGLYNLFLLGELGADKWFELYRKYSFTDAGVAELKISKNDLPPEEKRRGFYKKFETKPAVSLEVNLSGREAEINKDYHIFEGDEYYTFCMQKALLIKGNFLAAGYESKKFDELFPGVGYNGERFAVTNVNGELSLYDLFTNELTAKYSPGFSPDGRMPKVINGLTCFRLKKGLFDGITDLSSHQIITLPSGM